MPRVPIDLVLWRWQRLSALLALPLVLAHLVLQYVTFGAASASFDAVSARLRGGAVLVLDIALLGIVCVHAFLGLRSMLQDYAGTSAAAAWITRITLAAFVATFVYGLVALAAFV